jgi:hypothetical protein
MGMNEATGVEEAKVEEMTESQALAAGFSGDLAEVTIIEAPQVNEAGEEVKPEIKPDPETPSADEKKPEDEPFVVTKATWDAIQERLAGMDSLRTDVIKRADLALGKYGELNRTLQEMKQRPSGVPDMSKAQFKKLNEQFPEFAKLLAEDLGEVFQAQTTELTKAEVPAFKPEEFEERVNQRVATEIETLTIKNEKREIARAHRNWEDIVRSEEFKKWGTTQPANEWQAFLLSNDSDVVIGKLNQFTDFQKSAKEAASKAATEAAAAEAAAAAAAAKKQKTEGRLAAAVTPKGNASGPTAKTEKDYLNEGFKSVRSG